MTNITGLHVFNETTADLKKREMLSEGREDGHKYRSRFLFAHIDLFNVERIGIGMFLDGDNFADT